MRMLSGLGSLLVAAFCADSVCATPDTVKGKSIPSNVNPVADPTLCKSSSGTYFLFSTAPGIEIRTSPDLVTWTLVGLVWPNGASWTDEYTLTTNGNLWAPDCTVIDGEFYLYYAASSFGSQNSAIFFAKSSTGEPGSFTNEGLVTSTVTGDTYNAIDPNLIIVNGNWYLSLGSFWSGIKLITLGSSTGKPSNSAVTSLAERTADSGAIEASVIWQAGEYFYLFSSWDKCCDGTSSTYNIRFGRATSIDGPYVDESGVDLLNGGGTLLLGTQGSDVGPGGQDLFLDSNGNTIMVYHYYTTAGTLLGINKLSFSSGWPVISG
ncbi:Arabinan endo-1,5-alpha-L-arabinosidase [Mycena chlorophos]|uniref:Arabinan endo-1,5-alpha-L-arabinosidase n=1 Tax=Mycena chlorophos TaxID=658473 RepID=A0A8H6TKX8_MYCCL|nr:Arabinan endo-1,5-alpha-L-arabinosidase [Mycena chlorophos]